MAEGQSKKSSGKALGLIVVGGVILLAAYAYRQYNLLINASKKIVKATIHKFTFSEIDITVYIELFNKGDFSVDVTGQDYNVYVNDKFVSNITSADAVHIKGNGTTILPLRITFNPQQILSAAILNIGSIMNDKSKVIISVKGKLSASAGLIKLNNLPLDFSMSLAEIMQSSNA